jgi:hypothetical protein
LHAGDRILVDRTLVTSINEREIGQVKKAAVLELTCGQSALTSCAC